MPRRVLSVLSVVMITLLVASCVSSPPAPSDTPPSVGATARTSGAALDPLVGTYVCSEERNPGVTHLWDMREDGTITRISGETGEVLPAGTWSVDSGRLLTTFEGGITWFAIEGDDLIGPRGGWVCTRAESPPPGSTPSAASPPSIAGTYECRRPGDTGTGPGFHLVWIWELRSDGTLTITDPADASVEGTWSLGGDYGIATIEGSDNPFSIDGDQLVFADFVCTPVGE